MFAAAAAQVVHATAAVFGRLVTYTPAGGGPSVSTRAVFTEEAVPPDPFGPGVVTTTLRIDLPQSEVATQPTDGATVLRGDGTLWTIRTAVPDTERTAWICRDVQRA